MRQHGFDDRGIHDAVQIIGYFNYINRVADALGVEPESFVRPYEKSAARSRLVREKEQPTMAPVKLVLVI